MPGGMEGQSQAGPTDLQRAWLESSAQEKEEKTKSLTGALGTSQWAKRSVEYGLC